MRAARAPARAGEKGRTDAGAFAPAGRRVAVLNGDAVRIGSRYTVVYDGYLFYGDSDGLNIRDADSWDDVKSLINDYGDMIQVRDNEYGVYWSNGGWL